jgi:hypothetical protein
MFEYTHNNHFKFGYNGNNFYQQRESHDEKFTAQFGPIDRNCRSWKEANELAAKMIYDHKVGDIYILLSGGMDSEICLKSFLNQNLKVKAITLRFNDVTQGNEIEHVERIKSKYQIDHEYCEVSLLKFLESQAFYAIADNIRCVSPIIVTHLWLSDQIKGTPVMAQGEAYLKKEINHGYIPGTSPYLPSNWHLYESERLCSIYRHFMLQNRPAIPGFFQYLPEQFFSFLTNNKILQQLISNKSIGKLGTRSSKNAMSKQYYSDVPMRDKLHGWESIQETHDVLRMKLAARFPFNDDYYKIEVNELIKNLSGK